MDTDSFDADLRDRLGRSFGDGPSHRPLDDRVVAGHRALFRRRIGTGLAALAVVAVVGSSYTLVGGDDRAVEEPGYAASESPAAVEPTKSDKPAPIPWDGDFVRYDAAMELEVRPGAEVLERIENPADSKPPAHSDALTVSWKGETYWMLLEGDKLTESTGSIPASPGGTWPDLASWATTMIAADKAANSGDLAADFAGTNVRFDDAGRLVADQGYRILEQRTDVDLPDNFAQAGDTTAVALVEGGRERTWWLGRILDSQPDYIPYAAKPGQTLDEFLAFARGKYDAGVGLR